MGRWGMVFLFFTLLFFVPCFGSNPIDLFLKNHDCVSSEYFRDEVYNDKKIGGDSQWFRRYFSALYDKDQMEFSGQSDDRLIIRLFKLMAMLLKEPYGLSWCNCNQAPVRLRIQLAFEVFDRVIRRYPNTNQKLVYTSYASGKLLQDVIIIAGLLEIGYQSIDINLIDLIYDRSRTNAIGLYAPVLLRKFLRSLIEEKYSKEVSLSPVCRVEAYGDVYDYLRDVRCGVAAKSHIVVLADPGSDLLHEDFEYFGPQSQASLILFELPQQDSSIVLSIPRSKKIYYFYAKNNLSDARTNIRKILQSVERLRQKNNYQQILVQEMVREFVVKNVAYFQSPFRSLEDLKYEGSIEDVILFQLCEGVISRDVRDGLPLKNYIKTWL